MVRLLFQEAPASSGHGMSHWTDDWHQHTCPQCLSRWTCGAAACDPSWKRFCPHGELCHVDANGDWKVTPISIRKGRGVGPLFDPRGHVVVSPNQKGDQSESSKITLN